MESISAKQLLIPEGYKGKKRVKEADDVKLDVAEDTDKVEMEGEHDAGTRMTTGCRSSEHDCVYEYGQGKENLKEADGVKLDVLDVPEDTGNGKEQVKEANEEELDVPIESDETDAESSIAAQRHLTKDEGEKEESYVDARMASESQEKDSGQGKENLKEADGLKLDVPEDTAQTLNAASYAESSTAAQNRLTKGEGEIDSLSQEGDRIFKHARSLVEKVKEKCFIHKVHSGLRVPLSAKHYLPVVLSIGPYHHGDPSVQDMEKHKVHYMQVLLDRIEEESMAKYIKALRNEKGESQALDCYVDTFKMNADSFSECVVLDGLFMIELFRRCMNPQDYGKDMQRDMLFNLAWFCPRLARDMLLFENQIPLFVLRALFLLTEETTEEGNFVPLMLGYFKFNGIQIPYHGGLTTLLDDIPHLLGLVYEALVSCRNEFSVPETAVQLNTKWKSLKSIIWTGLVRLIEKALVLKTAQQPSTEWRSCEFIRTAVALEQVGVTFLKAQEDDAAFYDIRFSHGVLSIPRLVVDDNTKSFFRNLVAYEQYSEKNRLHRIVDYVHVMDCLINTGKDVELLRHCGIIDNRIGDDENVSAMVNYLCSNVSFDQDQFFYSKMFKDVNEFCMDRRNVWMAKLKNEYFGSPWSVISFLAAVLLLLLAALQTGYTVASYYK